ncbi:ACT domain-containing protein [Thermosyntropha sp.]|uniref:ACT domain-containing protein n=1 Tax=Thermosyntropha sp. TaxID=2740820 RepID=UPI0025F9A9D3|nr:ACT domain-containing protein [Thermosyntropha sp.]MBO8159564.1 ACT domain-containing protein [Thermosyntropha sp.]
MLKDKKNYYIVREDILPESIVKTAKAKEILAKGEAENVLDAVNRLGIARSTYYKYKDGVLPFFDADSMRIINISLFLSHVPGVLSGVLNLVASLKANVLTINQNLPLHGMAYVTLSLSIEEMTVTVDEFLMDLQKIDGVIKAEIVGRS